MNRINWSFEIRDSHKKLLMRGTKYTAARWAAEAALAYTAGHETDHDFNSIIITITREGYDSNFEQSEASTV